MEHISGHEQLKETMRERDLRDAQVAEMIGCQPPQVCKIRNGQRPSFRLAAALEDAYGIPMRSWLERQP